MCYFHERYNPGASADFQMLEKCTLHAAPKLHPPPLWHHVVVIILLYTLPESDIYLTDSLSVHVVVAVKCVGYGYTKVVGCGQVVSPHRCSTSGQPLWSRAAHGTCRFLCRDFHLRVWWPPPTVDGLETNECVIISGGIFTKLWRTHGVLVHCRSPVL